MKKNRFVTRCATFFLVVTSFSVAVFSCTEKDADKVKPETITDIILKDTQFSILRDIVLYAQMSDALRTENLTVFAPDNAAFGKANVFSSSVITSLPVDSAISFINSHIIKSSLPYNELKVGNQPAVSRNNISITKIDSTVYVNNSEIVIGDVNADNGIIHVIDSLLVR